jgi:NAD(P)-dependent dehydrogenase (short-subunit alcohol dehydrogenase family)
MGEMAGHRLAIVTGASGTLGTAIVSELTERDWQVIAVDMDAGGGTGKGAVVRMAVDLSDGEAAAQLYAAIARDCGPIDALINVAGGFVWEMIGTGSRSSWDRMYAINLVTTVNSVQAALPHLADGKAAIVNVGAAAANAPGSGMAPYAASKAGVRALTESLAEELRPRGISVNAVLPTILDTPTNRADMPEADPATWVKPQAAAKAIAFLVSEANNAITGAAIPLSLAR